MIAAGLVVVCSVAVVAWRDTHLPVLRVVHIAVRGLTRTYRILQVSDLHGTRFGQRQGDLARLVAGRHYDAVALTGDMVSVRFADRAPAIELARALKDAGPIFFVGGNHDDAGVAPALAATGVTDLDAARYVRLGTNGSALVVTTLSGAASARARRSDVLVALTHIPPSRAELASLAGDPVSAVALLAGHTHAGTVSLPLVGAVIAPPMGDRESWTLFPELQGLQVRGLRKRDRLWVNVSPGLGAGTFGPVPPWLLYRLGTRAEIDEIVLEPAR